MTLKEYMDQHKLTKSDVAEVIGMCRKTVQRARPHKIRQEWKDKLDKSLGLDVAYSFTVSSKGDVILTDHNIGKVRECSIRDLVTVLVHSYWK